VTVRARQNVKNNTSAYDLKPTPLAHVLCCVRFFPSQLDISGFLLTFHKTHAQKHSNTTYNNQPTLHFTCMCAAQKLFSCQPPTGIVPCSTRPKKKIVPCSTTTNTGLPRFPKTWQPDGRMHAIRSHLTSTCNNRLRAPKTVTRFTFRCQSQTSGFLFDLLLGHPSITICPRRLAPLPPPTPILPMCPSLSCCLLHNSQPTCFSSLPPSSLAAPASFSSPHMQHHSLLGPAHTCIKQHHTTLSAKNTLHTLHTLPPGTHAVTHQHPWCRQTSIQMAPEQPTKTLPINSNNNPWQGHPLPIHHLPRKSTHKLGLPGDNKCCSNLSNHDKKTLTSTMGKHPRQCVLATRVQPCNGPTTMPLACKTVRSKTAHSLLLLQINNMHKTVGCC